MLKGIKNVLMYMKVLRNMSVLFVISLTHCAVDMKTVSPVDMGAKLCKAAFRFSSIITQNRNPSTVVPTEAIKEILFHSCELYYSYKAFNNYSLKMLLNPMKLGF